MSYYSCKVKYTFPKPDSEEMQKKTESYLVFAESCTEAEGKMSDWMPANFQNAEVLDVKKTNINELRLKGSPENCWIIKMLDDLDGKSEKKVPFICIFEGEHLEEAVKKCTKDFSSEIESVSRFKTIIDEDLIDEAIKKIKRKVVITAISEDEDIDSEEEDSE